MNVQYYPWKSKNVEFFGEIFRVGIVQNPWDDSDKRFLYNDNTGFSLSDEYR